MAVNQYGFPPVVPLSSGPAAIDESAVRTSRPLAGDDAPVVLLLHGLGSHEEDLLGLVPALPDAFTYVSLRGVLGCGPGYAWLDAPPVDPARPELLNASAKAVEAWIAAHCPGRVAGAIGFSQGAMLALHLLRRDPSALDWVVQLSGAPFPAPVEPGDTELAARRVPALWGHGGQDPLFPPALEDQVRDWMREHTDLTEVRSPALGHGIDQRVLDAVSTFLSAQPLLSAHSTPGQQLPRYPA